VNDDDDDDDDINNTEKTLRKVLTYGQEGMPNSDFNKLIFEGRRALKFRVYNKTT
jgi:hypothetical protein